MRTHPHLLLLLFLAISVTGAVAGGSTYSMYGLGELSLSPNGRTAGLGSMSAALWNNTSMDPSNPAAWSPLKSTYIQGAFGYDFIGASTSAGSSMFGTARMRGLGVAIPIAPTNGMTLAMGFAPVSTVGYAFDFGTEQGVDSVTYVAKYTGSGGMSKFFFGSSYAPAAWLSLGASIEYNFGQYTHLLDARFSSSTYDHSLISIRTSPDGFNGRLSAMYSNQGFTGGVVARLPANLAVITQTLYTATTFGAKDSSSIGHSTYGMPLALAVGVSYRLSEFLFAAEVENEDWSSVLVNGSHSPDLQSSTMISFGVERMAITGGKGWDRIPLRFGAYIRKNYIAVNGTGINETFVTAGAGIPVNQQSMMDLALQYGTRGTLENNLVREQVFRLNLTFSISELWFQHPE